MDLLKTTLSDQNIYRRYRKIAGPLMTRQFILAKDLSNYKNIANIAQQDIYKKLHSSSVLHYANRDRCYVPVIPNSNVKVDTHFELERAGLGMDPHMYRTIISFKDSLDYILHRICNISYSKLFDELGDNYSQISSALLLYSENLMGDFGFDSLVNIDPKLDDYLMRLLAEQESSASNFSYVSLASTFFNNLLIYAQGYATFLGAFLQAHYKDLGISLVFKSVSASEVILATDTPVNETIELTSGYLINVISYKPSEVMSTLNHNFRGALEVM